jgi:RNA polymerase sigma factor (sigma-70 family)
MNKRPRQDAGPPSLRVNTIRRFREKRVTDYHPSHRTEPGMTAPRLDVSETDAAVIEQSWHEPEMFAQLYDRHAGPIHRYVSRRLGEALADDLVAETFLTAFRVRQRYDLARPDARPWLYGIAANMIGRHRRAEVRRLKALARAADTTPADPGAGWAAAGADEIVSRLDAAAVRRELLQALAELSLGDRDVLLLIAWAGLTSEETAAALGIPSGTVRSRLSRARRKVREALGGQDPTSIRQELNS